VTERDLKRRKAMGDPRVDSSLAAERAYLLDALLRARQERHSHDPELRRAARTLGRAARKLQLPPERLVITLKELVRVPQLAQLSEWFRRLLTSRLIVWAIDAYYDLDTD
jgi:hypothetical protein